MPFHKDSIRAFGLAVRIAMAAVMLAGCDSAPGPADGPGRPPVIRSFAYTPAQLNLLDVDPGELGDGVIAVDFTATANVIDPDGAIDRVLFVVRPPTLGAAPVAFLRMNDMGNGQFDISAPVELDPGEIGTYTIRIFAVDVDGLLSNQGIGSFQLINEGSPPAIESLDVPDIIQRPAEGTKEEQFVAVVSDPDGLSNIASVVFWNVNRPNDTFSMFDDGESGGDAAAGDGRFTATVVIASDNAPGVNNFAFQATDRAGLKSEVVVKEITIQ